jgi:signal transduction histidine kinase
MLWPMTGYLAGAAGGPEPLAVKQTGARPAADARLERMLRGLLEHPYHFSYAALVLADLVAFLSGLPSARAGWWIAAGSLLVAGWLLLWARCRAADPSAGSGWTYLVGFAGMLLLASLSTFNISFTIVAVTLVPQFFTMLPIPVATLAFVPMFIAAEHAHRAAVLAQADQFPWQQVVVRGAAVMVLGVSLRVLARQMDERTRLQASLAAAERRAGMLEERQRLAREIHDTLAQGFAGIVVHLETAEQMDPLLESPARSHLNLARSVAREGLEDARRMLAALRPEILEQRGLPQALERVCTEWSRRTGLKASLSITGAPATMHPDIELTILRALQESLTNIGRHAGARTAAVTLSYMEDILVLDVQDDGAGFDPALMAVAGKGFGLAGMRERAEALQGTFSLESVPGEGTTISLSLPVLLTSGAESRSEDRA